MKPSALLPKKLFTTDKDAQTIKEIMNETGLSDKQTRALVKTLVEQGKLVQAYRKEKNRISSIVFITKK